MSQCDYAYNKNNLHNFVYLLRHAIKYAPPYLKFVLTFTNDSILQMDEIARVLLIGSESEVHVNGSMLWQKYGEYALEVAGLQELAQGCNEDFERVLDALQLASFKADAGKFNCNFSQWAQSQISKTGENDKVEHLLKILQ